MAPNTIPGIFIGYYEDIDGLSKDYVVISFAFLGDAKSYPNERNSWRLTPQRVGRIYFNSQREPQFPLKPAYDVRRESILIPEQATGRDVSVWVGDPTLFDCAKDVPPVEPTAPRGGFRRSRGHRRARATTNWGRVVPKDSPRISSQH